MVPLHQFLLPSTNVEAGIGGYAAQTRGALYSQFRRGQYTDASLYSFCQLEFSGEYAGGYLIFRIPSTPIPVLIRLRLPVF
jgi:hypothetical protein